MKARINYSYGKEKKEEEKQEIDKMTPEEKEESKRKTRAAKRVLASAMMINLMGGYDHE